MIDNKMSPCFRGCGAWVSTDGPAICGACEVGERVRDTEAARSAAAQAEYESRRVQTEWSHRGYRIRTIGYAIYLETPPKRGPYDDSLFSNEARALAAALIRAADFVDALATPYTNQPNPAGDSA